MKAWMNPRWRIWIFLSLMNGAWLVATWHWVERENWLLIWPIALSINALWITYDWVIHFTLLASRSPEQESLCQELLGQDPWGVLKIVHELATQLRVPIPKVTLVQTPSAQIFAFARTRRSIKLFVTEGALEVLTPRQLRAVLTFQMISIQQSYPVLNFWLAAWFDMIARVGQLVERAFKFVFGWSPPLAAWMMSPWLAAARLFILGRTDFARLDRETARQIEHPEDLAYALWKLDAYSRTRPWANAWTFAHMFMVSPLILNPLWQGLQVQPPLKSRIKLLTGRFPL